MPVLVNPKIARHGASPRMRASFNPTDNFIATRTAFSDWSAPNLEIRGGHGPWLTDSVGKSYLDFSTGSGSLIFGHADPEAIKVLADQSGQVSLYPGLTFRSAIVSEYLTQIVSLAGGTFSRALMASSGTDAVEAACKLALQHFHERGDTQRTAILGRAGSYHGNSLFALSVGGNLRRRLPYELSLKSLPRASSAFCYRCQFEKTPDSCSLECADSVERAIEDVGPANVAALILEPVVGATLSAAVPDARYLARVSELCSHYDILLIFDEVLSGFARTGRSFAWQHWGIQPDILILGKAMNAGYFPASAIITTEQIVEPLRRNSRHFENGQTFQFSPVAAALGRYVIARIYSEDLCERARRIGSMLLTRLAVLKDYNLIGDIRGLGLMAGIELVSDKKSRSTSDPNSRTSARFAAECLKEGLVVYPCSGGADSMRGDHLLLLPPLTIDETHIDFAVELLRRAAERLSAT
jgi:adenosylmethionine-8-amino-7-oxononanoate aminotransferase